MGDNVTKIVKLIDDKNIQIYPETSIPSVNGLSEALASKADEPDREYDLSNNVMGYKILLPESGNTTFISQVTDPNTIYEIRDSFNLNNAEQAHTVICNTAKVFNQGASDEYTVYYYNNLITASQNNVVYTNSEHILYLNSGKTAYDTGAHFETGSFYIASFEENASVTYYTAAPITLPSNIILKFCGGIISNGVLNLTNSSIEANSDEQIFDNVIVFSSGLGECYVDWFGAKAKSTPTAVDCHYAIQQALTSSFSIVKFNCGYYYIDSTLYLNSQKKIDLNGIMSPGLRSFHSSDLHEKAYGGVLWISTDIDVIVVGIAHENTASYDIQGFEITGGTIDCSPAGKTFSHSAIVVEECAMVSTYPQISTSLIGPNVYYYTGSVSNNRYYCQGNGISFRDGKNTKSGSIFNGKIKSFIGRFYNGVQSTVSTNFTNIEFDCNIDNCVYAYDFGDYGNSGGIVSGSIQAGYWFENKNNGEPIIKGSLYKLTINSKIWDLKQQHNNDKWTNEYVTIYNPSMIQFAPYYGARAINGLVDGTKYSEASKLSYSGLSNFPYLMREKTGVYEKYLPHLEIIHNHYYGLPRMTTYDVNTAGYFVDFQVEENSQNKIINGSALFGESGTETSPFRFDAAYESEEGKLAEAKGVITVNLYNDTGKFKGLGSLYIVLQRNNIYRSGSSHTTWRNVNVKVYNSGGTLLEENDFVNAPSSNPDDVCIFTMHSGNQNATKLVITFENPTTRIDSSTNKSYFSIPVVLSMSAFVHAGYNHIFGRGIEIPYNRTLTIGGNTISMYERTGGQYRITDAATRVVDNNTVHDYLYGDMLASNSYTLSQLLDEIEKTYAIGTVFKLTNGTKTALVIKASTSSFIEPQGHTVTTDDFLKTEGTTAQRPIITNVWEGFRYHDTDLSTDIYKKGSVWVNNDGVDMTNVSAVMGNDTVRNAMSSLSTDNDGLRFYNKTHKRWELWNGSTWTNMDGSSLS